MIRVSHNILIPEHEVEISAIRAGGPGGQNVNKVSTAIHLRFDIRASSLPDECKARLAAFKDHRISKDGVVIIKAQRYRSQDKNREDAIERLAALVRRAMQRKPKRIPTRPGAAAKRRRVDAKTRRGQVKAMRGRVRNTD